MQLLEIQLSVTLKSYFIIILKINQEYLPSAVNAIMLSLWIAAFLRCTFTQCWFHCPTACEVACETPRSFRRVLHPLCTKPVISPKCQTVLLMTCHFECKYFFHTTLNGRIHPVALLVQLLLPLTDWMSQLWTFHLHIDQGPDSPSPCIAHLLYETVLVGGGWLTQRKGQKHCEGHMDVSHEYSVALQTCRIRLLS